MKKIFTLFRRNEGAAAIEMALILPIFVTLMMAAMEFAMIAFYSFVIESAMFDATRTAKVADSPAAAVDAVRQAMRDKSFGLLPVDDVVITTEMNINFAEDWQNAPAEQCQEAAAPNNLIPGSFCPCSTGRWNDPNNNGRCDAGPPPLALQAPGSIVSFIAFYKKPIYTPLIGSFLANQSDNRFLISAGTTIRNEPPNALPPPTP